MTTRSQHALSYAVLLVQADVTDAGGRLANALVDVQTDLEYRRFPALAGRYERERLLSMLEGFLGPRGMRDLHLPQRPPWAFGLAWVRNAISYQVIGRTPLVGPYLEWRAVARRGRRRCTGTSAPTPHRSGNSRSVDAHRAVGGRGDRGARGPAGGDAA